MRTGTSWSVHPPPAKGGDHEARQAIREFEIQFRASQRSPHTISSYRRDLGEFRAWLVEQRGPSEVRRLDAADVRLDERAVLIRQLKGGGEVRKALSDVVRQRLVTHLALRATLKTACPALFVSGQHRRLCSRQVQGIARRKPRKAGIERRLTVHGLRHCFATSLYEKTKNLVLVQKAMDHRSVASTLVYARVADERVAEAVAGM